MSVQPNDTGALRPSSSQPAPSAQGLQTLATAAHRAGFDVPGRFELVRSGEDFDEVVSMLGMNAVAGNEEWTAALVGCGQVWISTRGSPSVDDPMAWECVHDGRAVVREFAHEELYLRELLKGKLALIHGYCVNLDERGGFRADVRDIDGTSRFEVRLGNELAEGESSLVDDGFMRHGHDLDGLLSHLCALKVLPAGAQLLPQGDFERAVERFIEANRLVLDAPVFPEGPFTMDAVREAVAERQGAQHSPPLQPRMRN